MKLIKKIAAIMLSVMMILGMASVVSADGTTSGTSAANKGKITIDNAIVGQTYKIYKILELESFSDKPTITPVPTGAAAGNYAYKVASDWKAFINGTDQGEGAGAEYLQIIDDKYDYVKWNGLSDDARVAEFAKKALAYAKTKSITPTTTTTTTTTTVTFENLQLGYYLVDSSVGTLCSLDTTATDVTIEEKNAVPSVEKKVKKGSNWETNNTASIGDGVEFQTTITVQPGAQNYVLHDKMDAGLTLDGEITITDGDTTFNECITYKKGINDSDIKDDCTFEIVFNKSFCDSLTTSKTIVVTYSAILNKDAVVGKTDDAKNQNDTWLSYGDNSTTTHSTTKTKTFELPVFKYTTKNSTKTALAGATFTLSKDVNGSDPIKLVSDSNHTTAGDTYRVAMTGEPDTVTEVTTTDSGKFTIKGLDADTYYLTETQQPAGYNKLKDPVKVVIAENGNITVGSETVEEVKVQNNTGTILPTTGGNGTSLIYFLGAVLAIGSSVVLITKKRMR